MAQRERKSKSEIIIRCIEYYYRKKWPGNPQPPLFPTVKPEFVEDEEALREARLRKAVVFLRYTAKMSYQQIGLIVGRSHKFVRDVCLSLDPQLYPRFSLRRSSGKRLRAKSFRRVLHKYRERFERWMAGKFVTVEEAFEVM